MQLFEKDSARLTAEYGITVGRWEQYLGTEGKLPFGAMWSIVPPGGDSAEDYHEELELAVVISSDGEVESTATGDRRPTPVGTAALMESYERHVWHNRRPTRRWCSSASTGCRWTSRPELRPARPGRPGRRTRRPRRRPAAGSPSPA